MDPLRNNLHRLRGEIRLRRTWAPVVIASAVTSATVMITITVVITAAGARITPGIIFRG
jgi:hypothetical protein